MKRCSPTPMDRSSSPCPAPAPSAPPPCSPIGDCRAGFPDPHPLLLRWEASTSGRRDPAAPRDLLRCGSDHREAESARVMRSPSRADAVAGGEAMARPVACCYVVEMASSLAATGVVVVPQFIDGRLARMLQTMLLLRQHRGEGKRDDHMPTALSFWGDSTLDAFHLAVLDQVESVAGARLFPTYCYARLYSRGDTLHRHHDREACEIVTTIHLGSHGGASAADLLRHGRRGRAAARRRCGLPWGGHRPLEGTFQATSSARSS